MLYEARAARTGFVIPAVLLVAALLWWTFQHVITIWEEHHDHGGNSIPWVWLFAFVLLLAEMLFCFTERVWKTTGKQQAELDRKYLVAVIPAYNEDPEALRQCIASMIYQTRKPDLIWVTDDGSTVDYAHTKSWFSTIAGNHGIEARWHRQPNAGKRHAQGAAIAATPQADFYLTVDSDAILDPHAIEEGLKPFAKENTQSVAGVVMVANRINLLTRLTDLWFVMGQLVDRSSMSSVGGVLVNSGALAFYRGDLLRENLDGYLNEEFFGRRIETSDDSLLTVYALLKGKAVQQRTSFAFTLMPEKYSHHRRQYLRWMRGAFIRSFWRFRYLPLRSPAYWMHMLGWIQMAISTVTFTILFIYTPVIIPSAVPFFLVIPLLVGYGQGLRYFMIKRSDMSFRQQFGMFLLTPIVILYGWFILRVLRFYAMITCMNVSWGTRQSVEVTLKESVS